MYDTQSLLFVYQQTLYIVLILILHIQRLKFQPTYICGYVFHTELIQVLQIFGFVVEAWFAC